MRQTIIGTLLLALAAIGTLLSNNAAVAQILDPLPMEEDAGYESELPSPPQATSTFGRVEPLRDYSQAYLGVTFDPQHPNAAVARSVTAGSPADLAGIKAGDTIVSANGRRVASYDDVLKWVDQLKPGDVLDIDVSRRVSLKARAVLDGHPAGAQTSNYRPVAEPLPTPTPTQVRQAPRVNAAPQLNRPSNTNRNNRPADRDNRGRGRASRRR